MIAHHASPVKLMNGITVLCQVNKHPSVSCEDKWTNPAGEIFTIKSFMHLLLPVMLCFFFKCLCIYIFSYKSACEFNTSDTFWTCVCVCAIKLYCVLFCTVATSPAGSPGAATVSVESTTPEPCTEGVGTPPEERTPR